LSISENMEALLADLKNGNRVARFEAVKSLRRLYDPCAIEPLIEALKDEFYWVRAMVAEALGIIGDKRAIEPLEYVLKNEDEDNYVRGNAAIALGRLSLSCIDLLVSLLEHDNPTMRNYASKAIKEYDCNYAVQSQVHEIENKINNEEDLSENEYSWFIELGENAIIPLIHILKDKNKDNLTKRIAAVALGELGDSRALEPLILILNDKNEDLWVREDVARCLGKLGDLSAVESLISILKDDTADSINNGTLTIRPAFIAQTDVFQIGGFQFDFDSLTIDFAMGISFLAMSGTGTLSGGGFDSTAAIFDFTANPGSTYSLTIAAVPVPAAVWLFGSGLIGLIAVARRKAD